MSNAKPGDRVYALASANETEIYLFGVGVYVGDEVPPADVNPILNIGRPNPRINLDNGQTVWGCECWWGAEADLMKKKTAKQTIINTDIEKFRTEAKAAWGEQLNARAEKCYTTYCEAVGGIAFNGDPLPDWATFCADPTKAKQVEGWRAVAQVL